MAETAPFFREQFVLTLRHYGATLAAPALWQEIEKACQDPARHYHNLLHLDHLAGQLFSVRGQAEDWHMLMLATAYHDLVYDTGRTDNEARSADLAGSRIAPFVTPAAEARCRAMILATAGPGVSPDPDINLFTDADLSVLGATRARYRMYAAQIRKEYARYPDEIYIPGRKKVLEHFLGMPAIFKTTWFSEQYEAIARENLRWELLDL